MRTALGIEYDGAAFYGWQRQHEVQSVQQHLEEALSKVANTKVQVQCAGRTDAGVHATGQVVHFDCENTRPERAWTLGVNANLPDAIAVTWAQPVDNDFHARFSATARRYRYIIFNQKQRPAILHHGVTHVHRPLDVERMHRAAQALVGEHDFSSFRAALCQSKSPFRNLMHIRVTRHGAYILIDIKANAFVHHMVRNITGSLIEIGAGEQEEGWLQWLLDQKDRTLAAATAKPNGLVDVDYPAGFYLPASPLGPLFMPDD
jgi:tRNA pseudouridine38-40 synthase